MQVSACKYLGANNGGWIQQNFPDIYRIGMQGLTLGQTPSMRLYMTVISTPSSLGGLLGLVMGLFLGIDRSSLRSLKINFFKSWIKITSIFPLSFHHPLSDFERLHLLYHQGLTLYDSDLGSIHATFPFFARQVQVPGLDRGVIEAAQASGATPLGYD